MTFFVAFLEPFLNFFFLLLTVRSVRLTASIVLFVFVCLFLCVYFLVTPLVKEVINRSNTLDAAAGSLGTSAVSVVNEENNDMLE